jgi:hypothetical protein
MELDNQLILLTRRQSATIMRAYDLARNGGDLKMFRDFKGGSVVSAKTADQVVVCVARRRTQRGTINSLR